MSQNLSYATQELHKKIENLSVAHDKLCAIVNAQSHMIKILKTFHVEDFRKRKELQENRKNELLTRNSKTRSNISNLNRNPTPNLERKLYNNNTRFNSNLNTNKNNQQSFDAEYEEMKKQVSFLQSQLTQLTTLPPTTTTTAPVASNTTSNVAPAPSTV